mmetsp:Transcript_4668/g.18684  ORF Transcript_4668/g.18684 Transcript_4668/m.18684 type:complete len:279 (+) Transcript_4668:608-1444(+)
MASTACVPRSIAVAVSPIEKNTATYPMSPQVSHPFSIENGSSAKSILNQSPPSISGANLRSKSQSTANVSTVSISCTSTRYLLCWFASKSRGSTPFASSRRGKMSAAVNTKDALQPPMPKNTRHPPHGTSHRCRTVSRSNKRSDRRPSRSMASSTTTNGSCDSPEGEKVVFFVRGTSTPFSRRYLFRSSSLRCRSRGEARHATRRPATPRRDAARTPVERNETDADASVPVLAASPDVRSPAARAGRRDHDAVTHVREERCPRRRKSRRAAGAPATAP